MAKANPQIRGWLMAGGVRAWWVLTGLWLLYLSFGAIAASIAPLVGLIEHDLGMSHSAMGSIMGAWQLVYIFSAIPCGILLDRIGGKHALLIGVALIGLSALWRSFATDYWSLLLAVMLFGLGGPIISSGAPKLVAEWFSGSRRGLAMGIYMTGPALGGVAGLALTHPVLLPWLGSWREVMMFWSGVCLLAALVWLVIGRLHLSPRAGALDVVGDGLGTDAVETDEKTTAPGQLGIMAQLIRAPAVQVLLLMSVGVFLYNHGLNNWLPELLQHGGMSAANAGYWATIPTMVGILGSLLIPRLATPGRRFTILLSLALAALLASLLLQFGEGVALFVGLVMQGLARSSLMTILVLTLVELPEVGEARAGIASGMFFSAAEIGGVLGPLGIGLAYDFSGGFGGALTSLSCVAAVLMLGCVYLRRAVRS